MSGTGVQSVRSLGVALKSTWPDSTGMLATTSHTAEVCQGLSHERAQMAKEHHITQGPVHWASPIRYSTWAGSTRVRVRTPQRASLLGGGGGPWALRPDGTGAPGQRGKDWGRALTYPFSSTMLPIVMAERLMVLNCQSPTSDQRYCHTRGAAISSGCIPHRATG